MWRQQVINVPGCHILLNAGSPWNVPWFVCPTGSRPGMSWPLGWLLCCGSAPVDSFWAIHACASAAQSTWPVWHNTHTHTRCKDTYKDTMCASAKKLEYAIYIWNKTVGGKLLTDLDLAGAERTASTAAGSEATAARAVLPGPTSLSSKIKPTTTSPARWQSFQASLTSTLLAW